MGYAEAEHKYSLIISKQDAERSAKLTEINKNLIVLANKANITSTLINSEFKAVRAELLKSPLVIYKNGECTLSEEFLASRRKAISLANQR
jgi:hypothetical protein